MKFGQFMPVNFAVIKESVETNMLILANFDSFAITYLM